MKKALLGFVLICSLVLAAGADGTPVFRITGQLETGVQDVIRSSSAGLTDAISLYDNDSGTSSRFRIRFTVTGAEGNWGIVTRLDNEALANGGLVATWNQALLWGSLFDKVVTVKAGLLDEEGFSFTWKPWGAENIWGNQFDGNLGVELQLAPVEGLTLAYVFPILDGTRFEDALGGSYAAATFLVPDVFRMSAGTALGLPYSTTAWLGADLIAVRDLTVRVAGQLTDIGSPFLGILEIFQQAGYRFLGFSIEVMGWEEFYSALNSDIGWQLEPSVSYTLGQFTFKIVGDVGTLLANDPAPGNPALPFGFAVGTVISFALAPTCTIQAGARFFDPVYFYSATTFQSFIAFQWFF
jgi:hypothetical protein